MLTRVPWQPGLHVHVDLLVKLEQVRAAMGRSPLLYSPLSGWRSHAEQEALWLAHLAGRGNVASNPNTGNRTHMRGVAADLQDYSPAMQRALVAAGLQRDPAEAWHWQLPSWRDYPIIPTMPTPKPINPLEEPMTAAYIHAPAESTKPARFALVGLEVPGGSFVTTVVGEAEALGFVYGNRAQTDGVGAKNGNPVKRVTQAQLDAAVALYARLRAALVAETSGGVSTGVSLQPVLDALGAVPTAAQNGAAARAAIVK